MSKHEKTGTVTKQTTGAVSTHETGTAIKQTTGAVSQHETGTVTKQATGARKGFAGAVSKHDTGTVTKQTTGAVSKHETVIPVGTLKSKEVKFQTSFPLTHLASLCPGRREVRPRISTPLQHLREYGYLRSEHSGGTVRTKIRKK